MDKKGSFVPIVIVMLITLLIASFWNTYPTIKDSVHVILDPTAGILLNFNVLWGMTLLIFIITVIMTVAQKYGTDQKTLREMKAEQKELQKQMKEFKDHPQKLIELQKKQFEFMPLMMKHSMRPIIYTGVPIVLFFRWFMDYFSTPALESFRFFGFLTWFWYYLLASIIISSVLRKIFKVY